MGNRKNFHPGSGLAHQLRHQVQRIQGDPFILPPEQWGVVHAVHAGPPPTVDVIFDAATKISGVTTTDAVTKGVRFATGYQPHVGDTVCVLRNTHGLKTDRFAIFPPAGGKHSLPVTVTATTAGAPTSGTWLKGSTFLDKNDVLYVCTASGAPGTWKGLVPSVPAGRIYNTVQVVIPSGGSPTKVGSMAVDYTRGSVSYPTNAIQVPVAGIYRVSASIRWRYGTGGPHSPGTFTTVVYRNGTPCRQSGGYLDSTVGQESTGLADDIDLAANDVLALYGFQNSGITEGTLPGTTGTWLSVALVSA